MRRRWAGWRAATNNAASTYCQYTLQNRQLATGRDWFTRHGTAVVNAFPLSPVRDHSWPSGRPENQSPAAQA